MLTLAYIKKQAVNYLKENQELGLSNIRIIIAFLSYLFITPKMFLH